MAENKKQESIIKDALILGCITLISGLLLGLVYVITADRIAERAEEKKNAAYRQVCSEATFFEETDATKLVCETQKQLLEAQGIRQVTVTELVEAKNAEGQRIGYVMTVVSGSGYGGDITMAIGVDLSGHILGLEFLVLEETAGLGMNAKNTSFTGQFLDKDVTQFVVVKGSATAPDEILALSSATVTSRAVTDGVNATLVLYRELALSGIPGKEAP